VERPAPEQLVFEDDGTFPNSPLPVLLYRGVLTDRGVASPEDALAMFSGNGWVNGWINGLFGYHHYHSSAHEALAVAAGWARAALGGPDGATVEARAGDVLVLPAGVAHKKIAAASNFILVGAYPVGQDWTSLRGLPGERPAADRPQGCGVPELKKN